MSPSRKVSSPRELLVPYVEWLRNRCLDMHSPETNGGDTKISYGQRSLSLGPWELERLKETFRDGATPTEHGVLLAEIVALLLKCMADSERFEAESAGSADRFYRLQAELMLDSNLGHSLIGRTQRAVDSLIQRGMVQEAQELSGTIHKLRGSLVEVNRNAGIKVERSSNDDAVPAMVTSREIVDALVDPPEQLTGQPDEYHEPDTTDADAVALADGPLAGAARTRFLAVVFGVTLAIWVVTVELPAFFGSHPPQLKISDLQAPAVPIVVHSRWPSLYVEARGEAWDALPPEERARLVTDLVEQASERGFTSMLVRTVGGQPLAQWWRGRDVRWGDPADAGRSVSAGSVRPDAIETGRPPS